MEKGFLNKDVGIKSMVRFYCPYCGVNKASEEEVREHYSREMEWQDRWRESRPNYVKFVNPDGDLYRILIIRRVSNGYSGRFCGTILTIHASYLKASNGVSMMGDDESHLNANENFNNVYPATQDEYDEYKSLSDDERKELWSKEINRYETAMWEGISKNLKTDNGTSEFMKSMFNSMDTSAHVEPWDKFDNIGIKK